MISLMVCLYVLEVYTFLFNETASTDIYTLSLHDALPISPQRTRRLESRRKPCVHQPITRSRSIAPRSEEHTSELQSRFELVCRLLLEKKKTKKNAEAYVRTLVRNAIRNTARKIYYVDVEG